MKISLPSTGIAAVSAAAVVVVAGVALTFARAATPADGAAASAPTTAPATRPAEELPEVQVDDLAKNPDAYAGRVRLRGVVAGVNKEEGVVALIDAREFEACGTVGCAETLVPVRVAGDLPKATTLVVVTGELVKSERGLEFKAESVQVLP